MPTLQLIALHDLLVDRTWRFPEIVCSRPQGSTLSCKRNRLMDRTTPPEIIFGKRPLHITCDYAWSTSDVRVGTLSGVGSPCSQIAEKLHSDEQHGITKTVNKLVGQDEGFNQHNFSHFPKKWNRWSQLDGDSPL